MLFENWEDGIGESGLLQRVAPSPQDLGPPWEYGIGENGLLQPGIYMDLPAHVYHSRQAPMGRCFSSSWAKEALARSPAHAERARDATPAMALGSACHEIIEGKLAEKIIDPPDFEVDFRQPITKMLAKEYLGKHGILMEPGNKIAFDQAIHDAGFYRADDPAVQKAAAVADAIRRHPTAGPWLANSEGRHEVSIIFYTHGVRAKARIDFMTPDLRLDWKSSRDASRFEHEIVYRRHDVQAALYQAACNRMGLDTAPWYWVVIEPDFPCPEGVRIVQASDDCITMGMEGIEVAAKLWRDMEIGGRPLGYDANPVLFVPSSWAMGRAGNKLAGEPTLLIPGLAESDMEDWYE